MNRIKKLYALYYGDDFIKIGTKQELADYLHVKLRTIDFYASKTHLKRTEYRSYVVIKIEEDK